MRLKTVVLALSAAFIFANTGSAQAPLLLNYQGRVAVGGVNFNGLGSFEFALVNPAGTTTYWSNDGTSSGGAAPAGAVTLAVSNGLYSVLLGDASVPNMSAIPPSVFANPDVRLRIWFSDGTPHGFQLLTPDQRVGGGFAANAGSANVAQTVADGAIGIAQLAPNLIIPNTNASQINGQTLSSLPSGILKNNTGAGVPTIAGVADYVAPQGSSDWTKSEFYDDANHYALGVWTTAANKYQARSGQYWYVEPNLNVPVVVANNSLGSNGWTMNHNIPAAFYMDQTHANPVRNVGFRGVFVPDFGTGFTPAFNVLVSDGVDRNAPNWLCHFSFYQGQLTVSSTIKGGGGIAYLGGAGFYQSTNGNGGYALPSPIPPNALITCDIEIIDPGAATMCSQVAVSGGVATFTVTSTAGMASGQTVYECFSGASPNFDISAAPSGGGASTTLTLGEPISVQKNKRVFVTGTANGLYDGFWNVTADANNATNITITAPWKGSLAAGGTLNIQASNDGSYTVASLIDTTHFTAPALLSSQSVTENAGVAARKGRIKVLYAGSVFDLQEEGFAIVIASAGGYSNIKHTWWEVYPQTGVLRGVNDAEFLDMWANSPTQTLVGQTVLQWSGGLEVLGQKLSYSASSGFTVSGTDKWNIGGVPFPPAISQATMSGNQLVSPGYFNAAIVQLNRVAALPDSDSAGLFSPARNGWVPAASGWYQLTFNPQLDSTSWAFQPQQDYATIPNAEAGEAQARGALCWTFYAVAGLPITIKAFNNGTFPANVYGGNFGTSGTLIRLR